MKKDKRLHLLTRCLVYSLLLVMGRGCVGKMFYYPNSKIYSSPDEQTEELQIDTADGHRIHGWFIHSKQEHPNGTVLQFHGNAQNLTSHSDMVKWLTDYGYNVMTFDYRGYGKSEGKPSRKGTFLDGQAALNYLAARADVNQIAVIGQSLGGAVAGAVVTAEGAPDIQLLVIDSSFPSYRGMVSATIDRINVLRWFRTPLSFLVCGDSYAPCKTLEQLNVPVVFFHGTADQVVPYTEGRAYFDATPEPKEFIDVPNGGHTDAFSRSAYQEILLEKLEKAFKE